MGYGGGLLVSRRQVIGMVAAVVAGPFLHPAFGMAAAAAGTAGDLSFARFATLVGTEFALHLDGRRKLALTLSDARLRESHPLDRPGLTGESFSLLFAGRGSQAFASGQFTLT